MIKFNYKREMELLKMIYSGEIQVDELGRVYRRTNRGLKLVKSISSYRDKYRYIIIDKMTIPLHRLVWMYFNKSLIPIGMVINHKNMDREDCAIDNLECISQIENVAHAVLYRKNRGDKILPSKNV